MNALAFDRKRCQSILALHYLGEGAFCYPKEIQISNLSRCRYCAADAETLNHLLSHSLHSLDNKIKARHNKVERIIAAIKNSVANKWGRRSRLIAAQKKWRLY